MSAGVFKHKLITVGLVLLLMLSGSLIIDAFSKKNDVCELGFFEGVLARLPSGSKSSFYISGGHLITARSIDNQIEFSIRDRQLLASKLQELNFWSSTGVLDTSKRQRVTPTHICIIVTPQPQDFGKYIAEDSKLEITSGSATLLNDLETLKVQLYFNPRFYSGQSVAREEFRGLASYSLMSLLYDISLPDVQAGSPIDLSERYKGKPSFLAPFKVTADLSASTLLAIDKLQWTPQ